VFFIYLPYNAFRTLTVTPELMKRLVVFITSFVVFSSSVIIFPFSIVQAEEPHFSVTLYAGQDIDVGRLYVWNDEDILYVNYDVNEEWCLQETHVHIASTTDTIPQKNGNPRPGKFDYKSEHDCIFSDSFEIEIPIDWNKGVYIAAHAELCQLNGGGCESAWADGIDFEGKNWATYFMYFVNWSLPSPDEKVTFTYTHPGVTNTYFDFNIGNIGEGHDIQNGSWPGWCADSTVYITAGREYEASVYSSYSQNLPSYISDDEQWDYVNYILNHKPEGVTWQEIQAAIWYFTDEDPDYQGYDTLLVYEIIDDALASGAGFRPGPGQVGAVILAVDEGTQLVFMEVDP